MWPKAPLTTAGYHTEEIELHDITPVDDGEYESFLQEDDGQSLAATRGAHQRTRFVVTKNGADVTLRTEASGDGFPEFARERLVIVVHDGVDRAESTDGTRHIVIDNNGTSFNLDLAAL